MEATEFLSNLRLRWRCFQMRRQLDRDLREEIAFHLAMRAEKTQAEGLDTDPRLTFGNPTLLKEELREMWTFPALETVWHDLRYAVRMLWQSPAFTLVAIASLAIGIGANTAIFSLVDAVLLKSMPVHDAERLRIVQWTGESRLPLHSASGYSYKNKDGIDVHSSVSYSMYRALARETPQFSDLVGFAAYQSTVAAGNDSHYATALFATGNFFPALGVAPLAGRLFSPQDDKPGAPPVAVISYPYWEAHFGLDPAVVGREITVNSHTISIVGIAPQSFRGIQPNRTTSIFIPMSQVTDFGPEYYRLEKPDSWWVQILGRLRPKVDDRQALAPLQVVMDRETSAAVVDPAKPPKSGPPWRPVLEDGAGGIAQMRNSAQTPLLIMFGIVALVLLIACANLANLLLARGTARRREIAVRLSIGAGRWRLIRQLITESQVLSITGAGLGLCFASPLARATLAMASGSESAITPTIDARVLFFTAAAAVLTGLLFGLLPALRATRVDLSPALKDGSAGAGKASQTRLNRFLVSGQVALSTMLLAGAVLFVRTLSNVSSIDPGFNPQQLLIFAVDGSRSGYQKEKLTDLYDRIHSKLTAIPGVQAVTESSVPLIGGSTNSNDINVPGYVNKSSKPAETYLIKAGDHFLKVMGIPLLLGREMDDRDTPKSPQVAVVNETFVRTYLSGQNPIGKVFYFGDDRTKPASAKDRVSIIGVAKDARYDSLKHDVPPTTYLPMRQETGWIREATFELRTTLPLASLAGAVRRAVSEIDRNVPVGEMRTQEDQIRKSLAMERMFATLVSSFGLTAALLAAIGLYGLMAYTVARRTSEIGIRLALGAVSGDVQRMVLRESLGMVAAGLFVGIPAALALTRLAKQMLFGVAPSDPASYVVAAALMLAVAALAAWIPARRAARVDPMTALRYE